MRRIVEFELGSVTLFGTLDEGELASGLLIVSGGNEVRIGAHRGMASLAQAIAAQGHPVFRFDRRGIGDSEGENTGFAGSADDIASAAVAFRTVSPGLRRVVAFGNCDAGTALVLHGTDVDALVLANPWIVERVDALPAPAAIKKRYIQRIRDPKAWLALITGKLDLSAAIRGLLRIAAPKAEAQSLTASFAVRLAKSKLPTTVIVADGDNTGIAFADAWQSPAFQIARSRDDIELVSIPSSSHSFANDGDFDALVEVLVTALSQ